MMFNNADPAPPVNNLLQPDIYNRLDAEAIERTRVMNSQLDQRLLVQQRIIGKYRLAAERFHRREKQRVKDELTKITTKLPTTTRVRDFRNKFLYGARPQANNDITVNGQHSPHNHPNVSQSVPELQVKKIRGVPEEKREHPFCERFFIHHLPTKKKYYKKRVPSAPLFAPRTAGEIEGEGEAAATNFEAGGEEGEGMTVRSEDGALTLPHDSNSKYPVPRTELHVSADSPPLRRESRSRKLSPIRDSSPLLNKRVKSPSDIPADRMFSSEDDFALDGDLKIRSDNQNRRHSVNGRQSPRRREITRMSLPPLNQQNIRLALSSPELYHGTSRSDKV